MTDCLKILTGANVRYADLIDDKPKDTRSGEEIAADVIKKAGLKVVME